MTRSQLPGCGSRVAVLWLWLWWLTIHNYCCFVASAFSLDSKSGNGNKNNGIKSRDPFLSSPRFLDDHPKLILITGCSGTGKSTFGMSVALDQGILKCISTDTARSVMRSFIDEKISPALHRSSFTPATPDGSDDPVASWRETCTVLERSVQQLVDEMIQRGVSLVVEGVHIVPGHELIQQWQQNGGVAIGVVLCVKDEDAHRHMLMKRGVTTGKGEEEKLLKFERVRAIQEEMIRLGQQADWLIVEQDLRPDPLERVATRLQNQNQNQNNKYNTNTNNSNNINAVFRTIRQAAAAEERRYYQTADASKTRNGNTINIKSQRQVSTPSKPSPPSTPSPPPTRHNDSDVNEPFHVHQDPFFDIQ